VAAARLESSEFHVNPSILETILIVEDDQAVLKIVTLILEEAGFTVLPANTASQATRLAADFPGIIHLLLSDVEMPGISGPNLAINLKAKRPELRVILMSGQADGALLVLNYGWHFIAKPFLPNTLVTVVKDVLEGVSREQTTNRFDTRL
jgi:two-component system cell cycle sensor histidine kinase/response regulator CckA